MCCVSLHAPAWGSAVATIVLQLVHSPIIGKAGLKGKGAVIKT